MLVCMFSWEIKVQIYNKKSLNCMEAAGEERLMDVARIRTKDLVPTGFRFRPTDEELVCCYLKNKIEGNSLPCDIIVECELYGVKEPWEIWATFGGDHPDDDQDLNRFLYLFTRLKNMANRGSRIQRRVGSGSWKGERKADRVRAHQSGKCVGLKKRFHYENQRSMHHRRWLLDEYSLVPVKEVSSSYMYACISIYASTLLDPPYKLSRHNYHHLYFPPRYFLVICVVLTLHSSFFSFFLPCLHIETQAYPPISIGNRTNIAKMDGRAEREGVILDIINLKCTSLVQSI